MTEIDTAKDRPSEGWLAWNQAQTERFARGDTVKITALDMWQRDPALASRLGVARYTGRIGTIIFVYDNPYYVVSYDGAEPDSVWRHDQLEKVEPNGA